jgi:hypothetical protein
MQTSEKVKNLQVREQLCSKNALNPGMKLVNRQMVMPFFVAVINLRLKSPASVRLGSYSKSVRVQVLAYLVVALQTNPV